MSSPRHSPPPSAAAPKPKGILKNTGTAPAVSPGLGEPKEAALTAAPPAAAAAAAAAAEGSSHLAWDESNLTLHEIQREQQDPRMKIDEPKTPFVRSASFGSVDDDANFDLDSLASDGMGAPSTSAPIGGTAGGGEYTQPATSSARRSSAAEVLAANTKANANLAGTSAVAGATGAPAVGLDSVDQAQQQQQQQQSGTSSRSSSRRGQDSRSPSFTLPSSRRSSAAGDRSRDGVREEMRSRTDENDTVMNGVEGAIDDDDHDPEEKAKHDAFARKRNAHYGKEAEAMKIAAALAARDEEGDEE